MAETFMTPEALLTHWQGHRRFTRRTIEWFPEADLFTFLPSPALRSFGAMMDEVVVMIAPTIHGLTTGDWSRTPDLNSIDKTQPLNAWDEADRALAKA